MIVFNKLLPRLLLLLLFALVTSNGKALENVNQEQLAGEVIDSLTDAIVLQKPVVLDVRCGEWTPALERELRRILLSRQVDLREISFGLIKDSSEFLPLAMESDFGINGTMLLQMLNLQAADYLELSLEQAVETKEKKGFLSYTRYKVPVYRFILKQIALPEQRLVSLQEYKLSGNPEADNPGSLLTLKWYEPVLAGAVLGSLVYMLWTLK